MAIWENIFKFKQSVYCPIALTMPTVVSGSYLTLHYRLIGPDGVAIMDTFNDKPATLTLGSGQLAPGIEAHLVGLEQGAHRQITLAPGEAFGERNPELLQRVSRKLLADEGDPDEDYGVGDIVQFAAPNAQGSSYAGVVKEVHEDYVLLDFNHPLAGQALTFEVKLIGVL
jgi:FKBP-type peptidyl-prolyl cis-trans isomerase SlpA